MLRDERGNDRRVKVDAVHAHPAEDRAAEAGRRPIRVSPMDHQGDPSQRVAGRDQPHLGRGQGKGLPFPLSVAQNLPRGPVQGLAIESGPTRYVTQTPRSR